MTPAAHLAAAINILSGLERTAEPADRVIREFFRARHYAGAKDRAAVTERVFSILRHRYSLAWRMGGDDPRRLVIASLLADGIAEESTVEAFFSGQQYAPSPLTSEERAAIAAPPQSEPPLHVRGEFPGWLETELGRAFGPLVLEEMQAMLDRASIDLRVNTLKTSREALAAALESEGFPVEPMPSSPIGLRLPAGSAAAKLKDTDLFKSGHFEMQDEAAQIAALLCGVMPDQRVLDYAAGGGGKSLVLAALMRNRGEIVAHDVSSTRLSMLGPRAKRAGATIIKTTAGAPTGAFDLVLLDSPCSGTGTWRRQPELRGRITPRRLVDLTKLQTKLLEEAAGFVAPGGRLVYATCSMLPSENEKQIERFLAGHPDFAPVPVTAVWFAELQGSPPPGLDTFFRSSPHTTGTDGFFTAILRRQR